MKESGSAESAEKIEKMMTIKTVEGAPHVKVKARNENVERNQF